MRCEEEEGGGNLRVVFLQLRGAAPARAELSGLHLLAGHPVGGVVAGRAGLVLAVAVVEVGAHSAPLIAGLATETSCWICRAVVDGLD